MNWEAFGTAIIVGFAVTAPIVVPIMGLMFWPDLRAWYLHRRALKRRQGIGQSGADRGPR